MATNGGGKPLAAGKEQVPNLAFPESPARVLSKLADYAEWRNQPPGMIPDFEDVDPRAARVTCRSVLRDRGADWLSAEETRQVLAAMALPLPRGGVCGTAEDAARLAREIGFPVAVKLASRQIVHKTEAGGVRLNLGNESAVRQAFRDIRDQLAGRKQLQAMEGVIVQPMISGGVELMIGVIQEPSFGPLIAFGLGGVHVEILKDVCFRITPITDLDAKEMVRSIRGYRLLEGYRGHPAADLPAIENLLLRVAQLVEEVPEIGELDLNPVMALSPGKGCLVIDARIRVQRPSLTS
jgi:acyl-CoA synthetase (NDP forming)